MTVRTHRPGAMPLASYESVGTIVIQYHFPSGTQGPRHPNTGFRYHGTSRVAYLPVSGNLEGLRDSLTHRDVCGALSRLIRSCRDGCNHV